MLVNIEREEERIKKIATFYKVIREPGTVRVNVSMLVMLWFKNLGAGPECHKEEVVS